MARDYKKEFEWFHSHPEVGFKEYETTKRIKEILKEENIEEVSLPLETGVLAVIRGEKSGNNRLLRADIDALPVKEESGLLYASKNEGVMHACGHDIHLVSGLMTASILNKNKANVKGNVYILFQPGEEVFDGARNVIKTGVTKDIDEFYAFHVDPFREVGVIESSQGGVTSSVDRFKITVKGVGSHAAIPHEGENPISVITDIANWIYSRSDRHVDAFSPRVISITRINAGNIWNVIPESGELEGTIRTLDDSVRKDIKDEFNNAVKAFASLNSVTIDIEWQEGSHVAYNDEELYEKSLKVASILNLKTGKRDNMLIGDDFGDYAPKGSGKKSLYVLIGSGKGYTYHHPKFIANPDVLEISSKFMAELIRE